MWPATIKLRHYPNDSNGKRTVTFIGTHLPKIVSPMAEKWRKNRDALVSYALGDMNLAQLYTAIDSPVGGKWIENYEYPH